MRVKIFLSESGLKTVATKNIVRIDSVDFLAEAIKGAGGIKF